MAITSGIMQSIMQSEAMLNGQLSAMISTGNEPSVYNRHATAHDLSQVIPDYDDIYKFAVYRPSRDIYESDYRLHRRCIGKVEAPWISPAWKESVDLSVNESLEEFIDRRWYPWMDGSDPWDHWCDESVERLEFALIGDTWPWLLERLNLPWSEFKKINSA